MMTLRLMVASWQNLPWHRAALLLRHCLTTLAWHSLTRLTWDNLALFVRDCLAPLFLEHSGTFELGRLRSLFLALSGTPGWEQFGIVELELLGIVALAHQRILWLARLNIAELER